uniref:Uncharacterized protein n=1 Tax=Mycena chlorophos TaxID=658473 RepID=A0ABQ0LNQ0_MYCCL|nr:predicted protein [Mycena chlorophos]
MIPPRPKAATARNGGLERDATALPISLVALHVANSDLAAIFAALRDAQNTAETLRNEVKQLKNERGDREEDAALEYMRPGSEFSELALKMGLCSMQSELEEEQQRQPQASPAQNAADKAEIARLTTDMRALIDQRDAALLKEKTATHALEVQKKRLVDTKDALAAVAKALEIVTTKNSKLQADLDALKRSATDTAPAAVGSTNPQLEAAKAEARDARRAARLKLLDATRQSRLSAMLERAEEGAHSEMGQIKKDLAEMRKRELDAAGSLTPEPTDALLTRDPELAERFSRLLGFDTAAPRATAFDSSTAHRFAEAAAKEVRESLASAAAGWVV